MGWTARKVPESNTGGKEWAGNLVAHQLVQNADGTLGTKAIPALQTVFGQTAPVTVDHTTGSVSQNGTNFSLSANSRVMFAKLQKANQISFTLNTSSSGNAGLILAQANDGSNGYKIAIEPGTNRIASYIISNGTEEIANAFSLSGISGNSYRITAYISNDVCVVYVNDRVAFSNRVYDVVNKKWSIFSTTESSFSNINIKNP